MISQLRKIVAGPKNRTVTHEFDLDFTYITDTVAAMAFPASGLEKTYRNSIYDVAKYLQERHLSNYLIINVSNRKYDYKIFKEKVNDYLWEDHQAPTLDVLFEICSDSYQFLMRSQSSNSVVCFHCNHGKGRTGTAIICFLLYTGFFSNVEDVLKFYNKRRFQSDNYGVSQPCQLRYMEYFLAALQEVKGQNYRKTIKAYRLKRIEYDRLEGQGYEVSIYATRNQFELMRKIEKKGNHSLIEKGPALMSDIYIELVEKGWVSHKVIARANINLNFFMENVGEKEIKWVMIGSKVRVSKSHHEDFTISFFFEEFCKCHQEINQQCQCCFQVRKPEQSNWEKIIDLASKGDTLSSRDRCKLLFPSQFLQPQDQEKQPDNLNKEERQA